MQSDRRGLRSPFPKADAAGPLAHRKKGHLRKHLGYGLMVDSPFHIHRMEPEQPEPVREDYPLGDRRAREGRGASLAIVRQEGRNKWTLLQMGPGDAKSP